MDLGADKRFRMTVVGASSMVGIAIAVYGFLTSYPEFLFHIYVSTAVIAFCLGLALIISLEERRKELIDKSMPRFLRDIVESHETGLTLIQSLEESSHRDFGPLSTELRKLVTQLSWGVEFKEAFESWGKKLNTEMTEKIVPLILEAIYLGGNLKTVFLSTEEFSKKILEMRDERKTQLRPYVMIIYSTVLVFLVIIVVLNTSFFNKITVSDSYFLKFPMSMDNFKGTLFDLAAIEAFFGGLVAGKISQGRILSGIKHSVILLIVTQIVFNVFMM